MAKANVYGRVNKITNAVGRSDYISNSERQEEIVFHKTSMLHSWKEHSDFEASHKKSEEKNNEALEVHIALPNELSDEPNKLEEICDQLANQLIGDNHDYEYAVHWNHSRTNLHVHIMFSERENRLDLEPKVYKKDIWHDKDTHRLAKAHSENAILVHKKGEIQRDKDGNVKYNTEIFKPKDKRFVESSWVYRKNEIVQSVLKEHGFQLGMTTKQSPYLSQKKLYKNARPDYIEKATEWNNAVKEYNNNVRKALELQPNQLDQYIQQKKVIVDEVAKLNSEPKKITQKAIDYIRSWVDKVKNRINLIRKELSRPAKVVVKNEKKEEPLPPKLVAKGGPKGRGLYRADKDGKYSIWYAELKEAKKLKEKGVKIRDPYEILKKVR